VEVDLKTFKRTPKPSALFYRDIIRENGFGGETVQRYLKELPTLQKGE
jgi:beta-glucosidase